MSFRWSIMASEVDEVCPIGGEEIMTNKQRILQMVERWRDDISYDEALYHVYVLKKIDAGLKDIEAGRTKDFEEVFDELERGCDNPASFTVTMARGS